MNVKSYHIKGPLLLQPKVFGDHRGFFMETYKESLFSNLGLPTNFCQDNHSRSSLGVLRGMHFQIPPFTQAKLVRVVSGEVLDVIIDIRTQSETYGQWISEILNEDNKNIFYVPPGFAHGFLTLRDKTDFLYKVTSEYSPQHELGINPLDSSLSIPWNKYYNNELILSAKDKESPLLKNFQSPFQI